MRFTKIGLLAEFEQGKPTVKNIGNKTVLILNADGTFYALDEACPHSRGPLSEGVIDDLTVTCTWHGAKFSLETGKGLSGPCLNGVRCYQTRVCDDHLEIETD